MAGRLRPVTSPKPIRVPPAPGAVAVIVTSSASWRKVRTDPSARVSGSAPPQLSSSRQPRWSRSGPLTVPDAYRSPVRVEAPFTVICASICAGVQYMVANGGRAITWPLSRTSSARSRPHLPVSARYGSGSGSRGGGLTRAYSRASSGTIHGEIEVANDLARNGPSGLDSQDCRSREDQSLTRNAPNTWSANSPTPTGAPSDEPAPTTNPTSASKSSRRDGPNVGPLSCGPGRWPRGRVTGVPETTMVPERPW